MDRAAVLDACGRPLTPTTVARALALVSAGRAEWVGQDPPTIRLRYAAEPPPPGTERAVTPPGFRDQPLLLHICCGPCSTYCVRRLRELAWHVEGYWVNPNIHSYSEHERRRESLVAYAQRIALPLHQTAGYQMAEFFRRVAGHERFRERCAICYRMRLEHTADEAARRGFVAISTTLLISPYQDQEAIRRIGEEVAGARGLRFYYENLRRGYAESRHMAREAGLYMQRYCGCLYSEWEALDRRAETHGPHHGAPTP